MIGFNYRTCKCEDFPCCGHNDVDPNWEPDPYDFEDEDYAAEQARFQDEDESEDEPDESVWVHCPQRDGSGCSWCGAFAKANKDSMCRECFEAPEPTVKEQVLDD